MIQQTCINNLRQILLLRQPGSGQQEGWDGQNHRDKLQECAHDSFEPGPILVNFKKALVSVRRMDYLVRTRHVPITPTKMRNTLQTYNETYLITLTYISNPDPFHIQLSNIRRGLLKGRWRHVFTQDISRLSNMKVFCFEKGVYLTPTSALRRVPWNQRIAWSIEWLPAFKKIFSIMSLIS
jgi:hypothetical protein